MAPTLSLDFKPYRAHVGSHQELHSLAVLPNEYVEARFEGENLRWFPEVRERALEGAVKHCRRVEIDYWDFDKVYVDDKGNVKALPDPDELTAMDPASTSNLVAQ